MADAMMKPLGAANGVSWYWAEPGQFDGPGVYYWDGTRNVLCVPYGAATPHTEAVRQALTDPENQPNQLGVTFGMRGPKMYFAIGHQSFTLDYAPEEPGEFEFMRDMLTKAMSVFTPDVKPEAVRMSEAEIDAIFNEHHNPQETPWANWRRFARVVEQATAARLGVKMGDV